jgi:serine/threonine-protein kinase
MAAQRADYAAAAMLLRRAVTIAPTFAEAQEYLGMMQVEAGRLTEGVERLELAMNLDPLGVLSVALLWRHHALHGNLPERDRMLSELSRRTNDMGPLSFTTRVRSAVWSGDKDELAKLVKVVEFPTAQSARIVHAFVSVAGGFADASDEEALTNLPSSFEQPRFTAVMHQFAAEGWSAAGRHEMALKHVVEAASGALIDLEWLEHCALLTPLRTEPTFIDAVRRVRERASAIWIL